MPIANTSPTRARILLNSARGLADEILAATPSSCRASARWRLRKRITEAGQGIGPGQPDTRTDRRPDEDRPSAAAPRTRRWCPLCGCELPPIRGRGRPSTACAPDSGRACKRLASRLNDIARIASACAPIDRRDLRDIARDFGREVGE